MSPRAAQAVRIDARLFARPRFQEALAACDAVIRCELGWSFRDRLALDGAAHSWTVGDAEFEPAVTAVQIATAEVWHDEGIRPAAVAGASGGEYAAAYVAGALSLEDAMCVACCTADAFTRGVGRGGTIVAAMTRAEAEAYVAGAPANVHLAADYSRGSVALSGEAVAIEAAGADLSQRGVRWRPVPTALAVHSPLVDGLEGVFATRLRGLRPRAPHLPVYSAFAGGPLVDATFDAPHWWLVFRRPAWLADAMRRLLEDGFDTFVEFGLQPVLSGAVREAAAQAGQPVRVAPCGVAPGGTVEEGVRALAVPGVTTAPAAAGADDIAAAFDPSAADVRRDPYPLYRRLRERAGVVYLPRAGCWAVLRHAEAVAVLKDPASFSSSLLRGFDATLIGADPPAHTRVRRRVSEAFAPSRVARLEARVRERTRELLDRVAGQDAFDLVSELAMPLAVSVIAELLGIAGADLERLKRWSDAVVAAASGRPAAADRASLAAVNAELVAFMTAHVAARQDGAGHGILPELLASRGAGDDERLSAAEATSLARLLLVAGNETTTNLIGNAVVALLRHPPELARLRSDPALLPSAIEETLRYDAPVQAVDRVTTRAVDLAGVRIPSGARVAVMIGAANRDPSVFADPDRFRVDRDAQAHLAFGGGPHHCLGSLLARLEARCALERLLATRPRLQALEPLDDLPMTSTLHLRGPRRLMLGGRA
jgi:cytochrome P450/malonyl CoA-acyl carrier protein transacylase